MDRPPRAAALLVVVCLALVGCAVRRPAADVVPSPGDDRAARSRQLLELQVARDDGPGCVAAVGERGEVVWQSARGFADLEARTPLDQTTSFEIASVSKAFTALAVLLLAEDGRLTLADPVSRHVDGLPGWGDDVTLAQLMHHASGVHDYVPGRVKSDPTAPLGRRAVLREIAGRSRLDFAPGSGWAYSNSNYVLLAEVVEQVSGETYPAFLADRVFRPLGLSMLASPGGATPGLAPSYERTARGWESRDWQLYAMGAVGVRTTVGDLVRYADDYRTGAVGGKALLDDQWTDAPSTGLESSRYGAGIFRLPDGTLVNDGFFGDYRAGLLVSPNRERTAVLLCNRTNGVEPYAFVRAQAMLWGFR